MNIENLEEIVIAGQVIKIVKVENYSSLAGLFATWDSNTMTIRVDKSLKGKELFDTIAHEMLHATMFISGIKYILEPDTEEAIVRALENNFFLPFLKLSYLETEKQTKIKTKRKK